MDITKHCQLCDHLILDFKTGTICGISKKRPNFNNTCVNAKLDSKLKSKIEDINLEYQYILKRKQKVYINFVVYTILSIIVIFISCYFGNYIFEQSKYEWIRFRYGRSALEIPVYFFFTGVLFVLPRATRPLIKFLNELRLAKARKQDLDHILKLYNINYSIEISFGKIYKDYNEVEVEIDLKIRN
jgi:hypothetical protein